MIKLVAPETTTFLPSPEFSDSERSRVELNIKRSMNNTKRVYVKRGQTSTLNYSFDLTKMKALELRAFILKYIDTEITLVNHKDETWRVKFSSNPFDFSARAAARNWEGNELVSINLTFEGTQQ